MSDVRLVAVRSSAELARVREAWQALASDVQDANPFYEPWMFLPALAAGGEAGLCCLLVWRNQGGVERLEGFFPFRQLDRFKGLPLSMLSSWLHPSWPLGLPLVRSGAGVRCVKAIFEWLDAQALGAVEFRALPCDALLHADIAAVTLEQSRLVAADSFARPLLRRAESAEAYLRSALASETRKDLRRRRRRLSELGDLAPFRSTASDPAGAIEAFLALEVAGWKGVAGGAFAAQPPMLAFARSVLAEASRRGRLQIVGLDLNGVPLSRCINILAGETAYAYRTAYDERFARFSPGVLAEIETIEAFHADPRLQSMDSITDPQNPTLGRLWSHRRSLQSIVVASGALGELWVSMLPLLRWTKRRLSIQPQGIPMRQ